MVIVVKINVDGWLQLSILGLRLLLGCVPCELRD